jgi:hypothetical protein
MSSWSEYIQNNKRARLIGLGVMFILGVLLSLPSGSDWISNAARNLGSAAFTTAILASIVELLILPSEAENLSRIVQNSVSQSGLYRPGLTLRVKERQSFEHYNSWLTSNHHDEIFIVGISAIHSIDDHSHKQLRLGFHEVVNKRLIEGIDLTILFLLPWSSFLPLVARQEGQPPERLRKHIITSVSLAKKLYDMADSRINRNSTLYIGMYDSWPSFAYHKHNEHVVIGLYGRQSQGKNSPGYQVNCDASANFFSRHFEIVKQSHKDLWLLEKYSNQSEVIFNDKLYQEILARNERSV